MPAKVPTSAAPISPPSIFRRLVERAHGVDNAEHRGDDSERRKAVGDRLKRMHRLVAVVSQRFDFFVHQRLDLMGARVADDDEPAVVADERHQIRVSEQFRKRLEDFRFAGIVEMRLRPRCAIWPGTRASARAAR